MTTDLAATTNDSASSRRLARRATQEADLLKSLLAATLFPCAQSPELGTTTTGNLSEVVSTVFCAPG